MNRVVVIGGINCDIAAAADGSIAAGTSTPGTITYAAGGVGRNIAHALAALAVPVTLVGAVGDDPLGRWVLDTTAAAGVDISGVSVVPGGAGGTYVSVLAAGDLVHAVSDMRAAATVAPAQVVAALDRCQAAGDVVAAVICDLNVSSATVQAAVDWANRRNRPVIIEPVSVAKAAGLQAVHGEVTIVTPNTMELASVQRARSAAVRIGHWVVTDGPRGATIRSDTGADHERIAAPAVAPRNANGAGDCFVAGMVAALVDGLALGEAVAWGCAAGAIAAAGDETVPATLSRSAVVAGAAHARAAGGRETDETHRQEYR